MVDKNRIVKSKKALRVRLAALPFAEKLKLLDELRKRELMLRSARVPNRRGKKSTA